MAMKIKNENTTKWNGPNGRALRHLVTDFTVIMYPISVVVLREKVQSSHFCNLPR